MIVGKWSRRVLVVEDDSFTAFLIESLLKREDYQVQICTDASSARRVAAEMDPDLALLDVNLGSGPSGVQLGFILEQSHPGMTIVYLTRYPTALLQGGGASQHLDGKVILSKDDISSADFLVTAIDEALRGEHPELPEPTSADRQLTRLTPTQMDILKMLAAGMTNAEISRRRSTTERAVEKQVKAIYAALGLEADQRTNARVLAARRYTETMGEPSLDEGVDLLGLRVADEQSA